MKTQIKIAFFGEDYFGPVIVFNFHFHIKQDCKNNKKTGKGGFGGFEGFEGFGGFERFEGFEGFE